MTAHRIRLKTDQRVLLEVIYSAFRQRTRWPTHQYVDKTLDARGIDVGATLGELPAGLVRLRTAGGVAPQQGDEVRLTMAGVAQGGGLSDVDLFVLALQWLVEQERVFQPADPSAAEELRISSSEVLSAVGSADRPSNDALARLGLLIEAEPSIYTSMGHQDGTWQLSVSSAIRRFRGVHTLDDYLECLAKHDDQDLNPQPLPQAGPPRADTRLPGLHPKPEAIDGSVASPHDADPSVVWVVHGRNLAARDGMFAFLRALGLKPLEWDQAVGLTGKGSPYVGEVLDRAFDMAGAVVVLMTPDEVAYLRPEYAVSANDPDTLPAPQTRPNVLFEAGMALGRHPDRTVIVELGEIRAFSDVAGRHVVRLDGGAESRKALAQRLHDAGVTVDMTGRDWLTAGDLSVPEDPGGGLPLGRRIPALAQARRLRLDARYHNRGSDGRLEIINRGTVAIHDLDVEIPEEAGPSFRVLTADLPIELLPAGKSIFLIASRSMAPGRDHFMIRITGTTEDGVAVSEDAFVSLLS
ncbi:MAG: nucleotide-binding protein [Dehalococcoidia bacterium]